MAALADALQPAASEGPVAGRALCGDLSTFKAYMKDLRRLDDNIMNKLNTTNTTSDAACADFFKQIINSYASRSKVIKECLKLADGDLLETRSEYDDEPDNQILRSKLWSAETKRNMVANESKVEDIIRGRTLKAFHERCRLFQIPEEFYSSR